MGKVVHKRQSADETVLRQQVVGRADETEAVGLEQRVLGNECAIQQGFFRRCREIGTNLHIEDTLAVAQAFVLRNLGLFQSVFGFAGCSLLRTGLDLFDAGIQHDFRLWHDSPTHHRAGRHLFPRRGAVAAAKGEAAVRRYGF